MAQAARTRVFSGDEPVDAQRGLLQMEDYVQTVLAFDVTQGAPVRVEKMVALYTSHDRAISEPLGNAGKSVGDYPSFGRALAEHRSAWDELWEACDLVLPGNARVQLLLRLHIAHVLQVCSRHTADKDAGVVARGLNGEAYRGHVFWDELYVFPFLNFRLPRISRHLLQYRARRLGEARRAARAAGYRGAMYPWQSGSDGQEETQVVHLNPLSGRWERDLSHNQRHVNAAIFYNVWQYYQATGDVEFMLDHGAEMMLEIARFWSSLAHYNPERDRYEIHGVMGPDEFHEKYPGAAEGGLRNNAYTNVMVAWICATAPAVLGLLPARRAKALRSRIDLTDDEVATWAEMSRKMLVPFHGDGIISQFEGYEELAELDWDGYRERYDGRIQRLDRILRAEGDDPDRYKLAKQADTVMLFFLFSEEELGELFERLGYELGPDAVRRNIEYYDARTSHGSTLSFITHAAVLAAIGPRELVGALPRGARERHRRHPGRHDQGGHPHGRDVRHARPGAARVPRHRDARGRPVLRPAVDRSPRGPLVRDAGPRHADPSEPRRRPADRVGPRRGRVRPDQDRRRRRGSRAVSRRPLLVRAGRGAGPRVTANVPDGFGGAVFDVDGVLVDSPHERAWRDALRELMEGEWSGIRDETTWSPEAFTPQIYQQVMSGKPRLSGARAALDHFGVPDAERRTIAYADRKQTMVTELIEEGEFEAYPDALRLVLATRAAGVRIAAASSSKNAGLFLRRIRLDTFAREQGLGEALVAPGQTLLDVFDADVSGRDFAHGKPHPEIFLTAAAELGVPPGRCFVVEDAVSGIQAAKAGGMAALGVARADDAAMLAGAGADLVVESLDEVDVARLGQGRLVTTDA